MIYYKFIADTPTAGTENTFYLSFENDVSEAILEQTAEEYKIENGEEYEYCVTGWDEDWKSESEREEYFDECTCEYFQISREEYEENT